MNYESPNPPASPSPLATAAQTPGLHAVPRTISVNFVALLFAAELLLNLLLQLPTVADFKVFAFYDQGASLRLDQLFAAGRRPTIDLGYSYGMLPLVIARVWFALFGRTPAAFIAFVTFCNLIGAVAIARFLAAIQPGRHGAVYSQTHASKTPAQRIPLPTVTIAALLLPFAITPDNYSFMHPLELALFLLALSQQARGRYGSALAFATAALLTKPSMAYVLGFLLLCFAFRRKKGIAFFVPPLVVLAAGIALFALAVSPHAAFANLLPLTGGNSYRLMNFGFFHAGRTFWLHPYSSLSDTLQYYFLKPVLFWIVSTLCIFGLALPAIRRLFYKDAALPNDPLLITIALLHAAFIFIFYAWDRSWTYYSYLPILGLLVGLPLLQSKKFILVPLLILALFAYSERLRHALDAWKSWRHTPDTANLWTFDEMHDEWTAVRRLTHTTADDKTLFLTNGALSLLFPEIQTPESWFLSPGIPTPVEIDRVQKQINHADLIVLCKEYNPIQEAWNWPELAPQRNQFNLKTPRWEGKHFLILQRITPK